MRYRSAGLTGEALLCRSARQLPTASRPPICVGRGRDATRAKVAGTLTGNWSAQPDTHLGHELIAAGLLILAGVTATSEVGRRLRSRQRVAGGYDPSGLFSSGFKRRTQSRGRNSDRPISPDPSGVLCGLPQCRGGIIPKRRSTLRCRQPRSNNRLSNRAWHPGRPDSLRRASTSDRCDRGWPGLGLAHPPAGQTRTCRCRSRIRPLGRPLWPTRSASRADHPRSAAAAAATGPAPTKRRIGRRPITCRSPRSATR
jgi:hypothetical protein